jgi:hypothetical protein
MKISQFQKLLESAEQMHRDAGNAEAAQALGEITNLFAGHGTKTVATFAAMIEKAAAAESTQ